MRIKDVLHKWTIFCFSYFFYLSLNFLNRFDIRIGLSEGHFPVGLLVKILKAPLHSLNLAIWHAHLNFLDLTTLTILNERCKQWSSLLWSLLHSPLLYLLGSYIRLRILFSNILSLHSSLNVRDHVSHPYSTTGNIIVLYILIFPILREN